MDTTIEMIKKNHKTAILPVLNTKTIPKSMCSCAAIAGGERTVGPIWRIANLNDRQWGIGS